MDTECPLSYRVEVKHLWKSIEPRWIEVLEATQCHASLNTCLQERVYWGQEIILSASCWEGYTILISLCRCSWRNKTDWQHQDCHYILRWPVLLSIHGSRKRWFVVNRWTDLSFYQDIEVLPRTQDQIRQLSIDHPTRQRSRWVSHWSLLFATSCATGAVTEL